MGAILYSIPGMIYKLITTITVNPIFHLQKNIPNDAYCTEERKRYIQTLEAKSEELAELICQRKFW